MAYYNKQKNDRKLPEFYVFYDTETTGANPRFDQILQIAAILTDEDFNEIETIDLRSQLAYHVVPSAGALKVTHVDPYEIARAPFMPYDYAHHVYTTLERWSSKGKTSFDGFNSLRFDEEIMRQMFWENMHNPYITTSNGNTRNDYLHFLRALYARNPEAIDFPVNEETGKRSFKLEIIAPANGFEGHHAHDALGDVRATIFIAQLIKDTDPALFEHMVSMGSANAVRDFVDTNITFRMLGGPMLNPGILDVCLIASEAANPKSKVAWNLAIDPIPYLEMSPEEILDAMRKTGTPFRTLKCNKTPGVFPLSWEFLNCVSNDEFQPPDADTIDIRSDIIREHTQFQKNVAEAMRLKIESYDDNETLEEQIYSGFPSREDEAKLKDFQRESDWGRRLDIVRTIKKRELRNLGLRCVHVNSPATLGDETLKLFNKTIEEVRHCHDIDKPWNTLGTLMHEVDQMLAKDPDDEEVINIRNWAIETYPLASSWVPLPPKEEEETEVDTTPTNETLLAGESEDDTSEATITSTPCESEKSTTPDGDEDYQTIHQTEEQETAQQPTHVLKKTVAAVHFLDGLE